MMTEKRLQQITDKTKHLVASVMNDILLVGEMTGELVNEVQKIQKENDSLKETVLTRQDVLLLVSENTALKDEVERLRALTTPQPIETLPRKYKCDGGTDFILVLSDGQRWLGEWRKMGFSTPCYPLRLVPDDEIESLPEHLKEFSAPFSRAGVVGWLPMAKKESV